MVAGAARKEIGVSGKEELLLKVAFQNLKANEFYLRDISFGTEEYIRAIDKWSSPVAFLEDYKYIGGENSWRAANTKFEDFIGNFQEGDQVAFMLANAYDEAPFGPYPQDIIDADPNLKINADFMEMYWVNNKSFYEAMKIMKTYLI